MMSPATPRPSIRRPCSERRGALLLAFAVSLVVHLLALFAPQEGWLPSTDAPPPPLDAQLVALPLPHAPRVVAKTPDQPAAPTPAAADEVNVDASAKAGAAPDDVATALAEGASGSATAADAPPVAGGNGGRAPAPAAANDDASAARAATPSSTLPATLVDKPLLPSEGALRYRLCRGTKGFEVGQITVHWQFGDGRYVLTSVTETTGLVALFRQISVNMRSEGRFTEIGLQPERFTAQRSGGTESEGAQFDWSAQRVKLTRHTDQFLPLSRGSQDLLSFPYQFAYLMPRSAPFDIGVVTGKKYASYHVQVLGEETLDLSGKQYPTLHLRAQGDDLTDLWLARERFWLPVRIRHTDRKGEVFEQILAEPAVEQK
jgi:hypothetical protein